MRFVSAGNVQNPSQKMFVGRGSSLIQSFLAMNAAKRPVPTPGTIWSCGQCSWRKPWQSFMAPIPWWLVVEKVNLLAMEAFWWPSQVAHGTGWPSGRSSKQTQKSPTIFGGWDTRLNEWWLSLAQHQEKKRRHWDLWVIMHTLSLESTPFLRMTMRSTWSNSETLGAGLNGRASGQTTTGRTGWQIKGTTRWLAFVSSLTGTRSRKPTAKKGCPKMASSTWNAKTLWNTFQPLRWWRFLLNLMLDADSESSSRRRTAIHHGPPVDICLLPVSPWFPKGKFGKRFTCDLLSLLRLHWHGTWAT